MTAKLSANYVVKNRNEIINYLYDIILNIPNIKKKLLGIVDKPKLSEEEKKEINKQRSREQYLKKGVEKWGEDLTEIFIKGTDAKEHAHKIGLGKEFDNNEQYNIIRILKKC